MIHTLDSLPKATQAYILKFFFPSNDRVGKAIRDIFNKVVEKFNLRSVMIVDEGDYYRNTERGTELYYYIEDELLSNFNIIDE